MNWLNNIHNFNLIDEGDVQTYLGIQVELNKKDNTIKLKQPFLIERTIQVLECSEHMVGKETPVLANNILHKDKDGPDCKQYWL